MCVVSPSLAHHTVVLPKQPGLKPPNSPWIFFEKKHPELAKDLNEKSKKLAKLGAQFPNLLIARGCKPEKRVEVVCIFEGLMMR